MAVLAVAVTPDRRFERVIGKNNPFMADLTKIFNEILKPLYGSQEKALSQIEEGKDRTCFLLYEGNTPVGVLAYKTVLSDEFREYGVKNSIEIKSLFVVQSQQNSGRGLGGTLLSKCIEEVNKLRLNHESIHVTVSETKQESLTFFRRKGFKIRYEWTGKYVKDTTEYLLAVPAQLPMPQQLQRITQVAGAASPSPASAAMHGSKSFAKQVSIFQEAHYDDIHELILLSDGTFISGSKDNCIIKWNQRGEVVKEVMVVEPEGKDDRSWITAMSVINDCYWISGERNGRVSLWNTEGEFIKNYNVRLPKNGHISHEFNKRRVNCLAAGKNIHKPTFFAGFPTMFDEFNVIEGRTVSSTLAHNNDWVFCIHPLTENRLLSVVGGTVDVFERTGTAWNRTRTLLKEGPRVKGQRAFISALTQLSSTPHHFGLGIFGKGEIKVLDIEKGEIVRSWAEHNLRIWKVCNLSKDLFASCAEDRTIKFWDVRSDHSVATIDELPGEPNALLSLDENRMVAGISRKDAKNTSTSADLYFYDLRK